MRREDKERRRKSNEVIRAAAIRAMRVIYAEDYVTRQMTSVGVIVPLAVEQQRGRH
ncbi:MAG: hypothetical protein ACREKR_15110 [Candidatus Methylomirabilales bacterium]